MALFTEDLFNVFEEEPENRSTKPKKRRRDGPQGSLAAPDEAKKAKVDCASGQPSPSNSVSVEALEDEPLDAKDDV